MLISVKTVRRLCWFGHVEHSSGAVRKACDKQIDGRPGWQANMEETDGERLSWVLTLKNGAPGDEVRDLLCVQLASCGWCTCTLFKNLIMMMMIPPFCEDLIFRNMRSLAKIKNPRKICEVSRNKTLAKYAKCGGNKTLAKIFEFTVLH